MNKLLSLALGLFLFSNPVHAQVSVKQGDSKSANCMWRSAGGDLPYAQRYTCSDGEKYLYGRQTCGKQTQERAFCNINASSSKQSCADNFKSKKTKECFSKYIAPILNPTYYANKEFDGSCNWTFSGGEEYKCGNDSYMFGKANCKSGVYKNIFCRYQFASSGKNCAQDKHEDTISCYNKFVSEKHPQLALAKPTFTPRGAQ